MTHYARIDFLFILVCGLWGKIKGYFRKNLLKSVGIDTISFLFSFYFVCNFVINGVKVLGKV